MTTEKVNEIAVTAEVVEAKALEISLRDKAMQGLDPLKKGVAELKAKFTGFAEDATNPLGMAKLKAARIEIREGRYKVPHIVKAAKKKLKEIGDEIESVGDWIITEHQTLEDPIHKQIDDEEKRKDAEKAEKAALAAAAQKLLDDKIIEIGKLPLHCIGQTSDEITLFIAALDAKPLGGEFTGDTRKRAEDAKEEAIIEIRAMLTRAIEAEEKAATLAAALEVETVRIEVERIETERLAAIQREEMAAQQAELDEQKRLNDIEAARLADMAAIETERMRIDRAIFEDEKAEVAKKQAEVDRIAAVKQAELQAAIDEASAIEKRVQDEADAKQREIDRQAAIVAEAARKKAETERKAAEKKAKLLAAKCADASTAFLKILDICNGNTPGSGLEEIATICEAMLQ